ncbi:hypothetical protein PHMEG_0009826 [Phytophthora megakarya]|uniref:Uncharacterized protein n=1 Tax=Phytophthora megakarya TaxID=4795 RepID=A0A225WHB8_9STRA|nr:hypothetical protein PHMEG_0009826 [Phytophthora megakarya]
MRSCKSSGCKISSATKPNMIYDYGFPSEAYNVNYAMKDDPAFAHQAKKQREKNANKGKLV